MSERWYLISPICGPLHSGHARAIKAGPGTVTQSQTVSANAQ